MILYYSIHYPKPEKEALLIDGMRQVGKVLKGLPGCLFDNAFRDANAGTIMAVTIWESQEAFQAARPAMMEALRAIPLDEWEARPRELYMLNSLW
jgi:heme-degrading monooxygenase HmoA